LYIRGDQPRVWAAEPSNNAAQAEAKTAVTQDVQAAADETDGEGMDFTLEGVTVEAKRPDWEAKLSPGTVTVIRPDDYKGEQKDLPDLLKMVPGVHVRELNGKGQYTTVSVRGSTAAQVGVFVDGVLFNLGGDAAADISTIPVHNVERIEVYRGYIPARFGGTFMGGVINVVTKRPTKANVQASFGKSSFGGYKGNLQIDAPLGGGALMVGINRDQSDGDFKYKNFDNDRTFKERLEWYHKDLEDTTNRINNQIAEDIGYGMPSPIGGEVKSIDEMVTRCAPGGDIYEAFWQQNPDDYGGQDEMNYMWETYYAAYADPDYKENLYKSDRYQLDKLESAERWRKANDYKNTDAIIKWQDDHWLAKATWKNIRRHLPHPIDKNYAPLWTVDQDWAVNMPYGKPNMYYFRNQELTAKELLLGRRDTVGNLEWGWSINYLKQDKDYYIDDWQNLEKVLEATSGLNTLKANTLWSKYDSRRLGAKIDGSYKAGNRHLIEFLVDASKEKMDIDGWKMFDFEHANEDTRSRWRNYYEQEIINAQIQDTITLNKKGDFWLTPSIRYNRSKILGRSDRYDEKNDPQHIKWLGQTDEQTDDKVTWQLALKKQFNDHFTLRATGGTYYRLLNMYEIAGDGAGILPMPNVGGSASVFPMPEEGKQWDISAIWDGKWLGADTAKFQITYFGRDSKRLLQLSSWNSFFFVYNNAASGKVSGVELQADLSWQKWDVNLQATYTDPSNVLYDLSAIPGQQEWNKDGKIEGVMTYQPKWEGTARFTYRPDKNWSLFTQMRHVGKVTTDAIPLTTGALPWQSSLTTMDVGVKYKINKSLQVAVGCNDVLNKANDMYLRTTYSEMRNILYPIQGRTYYATLQYTY
jgi:vitamin B12 transporter